jgi:hypothetical protein
VIYPGVYGINVIMRGWIWARMGGTRKYFRSSVEKVLSKNPRDSSRIRYEYLSKIICEEGSCVKLV